MQCSESFTGYILILSEKWESHSARGACAKYICPVCVLFSSFTNFNAKQCFLNNFDGPMKSILLFLPAEFQFRFSQILFYPFKLWCLPFPTVCVCSMVLSLFLVRALDCK